MVVITPFKGDARISSKYGMRIHPISKIKKMHYGIDFVIENREILSAGDGYVKAVGYDSLAGNYIIISHKSDVETHYYHLDRSIATEGEFVTTGIVIGIQGATGSVTGEHLHFGIKHDGSWINPADDLMIKNEEDDVKYNHWGYKEMHEAIRQGYIVYNQKNMEASPTWAEVFAILSNKK